MQIDAVVAPAKDVVAKRLAPAASLQHYEVLSGSWTQVRGARIRIDELPRIYPTFNQLLVA